MKVFILFTFLTIANATASVYSQSERISLSVENGTVYDVLKSIEQNSEFKFFYQNEQIDASRSVSIAVKQESIDNILGRLFKNKPVKIQILDDNLIVLTSSQQQEKTVTGVITASSTGEPLPGVNIIEKGTTNGVVSDLGGNYSITLTSENPVLEFSYLGYNPQEMEVGTQTKIDISLVEDFAELEEIVIVGYGQIKKTDLTGSVSSLDEEALTERSVNNPMEALQGNVAGVTVSSSTGRLGDAYSINIRGNNSLDNDARENDGDGTTIGGVSQPLYIIDGVASEGMDFLNPHDIARIDILKDASSTAIYGSRGSNGVVIVTTKSGATAKKGVNVSFDSYYGIKKVARMPDFMDGQEWWHFHKSAYTDADMMTMPQGKFDSALYFIREAYPAPYGRNARLHENAMGNITTDWVDLVTQDGMMANNYLSVTGGGENVSYNIGAGAQNETGLIQKEALDKYTLKSGFDAKLNKHLKAGINITYAHSNAEQGSNRAMEDAFRLSPLFSPYEDGSTTELCKQPGKLEDANGFPLVNKTSTWNPLMEIPNASDIIKRNNLITSSYLLLSATDWLSIKSTFSSGYDSRERGQSWGIGTKDAFDNSVDGSPAPIGAQTKASLASYTWDNQLNFDYTTSDNMHSINALALQSIYSQVGTRNYQYARYLPFETGFYNLASAPTSTFLLAPSDEDDPQPYWSKETLSSFALRFNYSYAEKYLLTLTNRWDGSSVLAEGEKWESFPSAAVAWRISEESFMKSQDIVSQLKARASIGYTGNNAVDPYNSMSRLNSAAYYSYNESTTGTGWLADVLSNPALTWEKTREFNFGLDYGFFRNRINGVIDIYSRLTDGIIMTENLPLETGWESIKANVGQVSNKGIEFGLNTVNVQNSKVFWETSFLFSKNVNEIIEIHGQTEKDDIGNGLFIGEAVSSIYNYEFDGIVQADEVDIPLYADAGLLEGMAKVKDINDDGELDEDDRTVLGSADPNWTGTFTSKLRAFNFDFSVTVLTFQGIFVNSPFHRNYHNVGDRGRQKLDIPYYVPENNLGLTPNFSNEFPRPRREGNFWNEDMEELTGASYTKIKNITIGYKIPQELLSKVKINSARIYFNVIDPFVFTEYTGFDPEWATASLHLGRVGYTTYQIGLNLKF